MLRSIRRSKHRLFSRAHWKLRLVFWGGAVAVGITSTLFAVLSDHASKFFDHLLEISPYLPLLITPAGLLLIAWLTQTFFRGAEGSGIPQAIAALRAHDNHSIKREMLSMRIGLGKIVLTLLGLAVGASVGREGPTVHVGAAIMYGLGRLANFPTHYIKRGLILAGGAAGIAAAFNTPLAGIVFTVEEMSRAFDRRTSSIVVTAVIIAGLIALVVLGDYDYFGTTDAMLTLDGAWLAVPICGLIGGLGGGVFSSTLIWGKRILTPLTKRHPLWVAGLCGLIVAIVGLLSGNLIYGTGYLEAKQIITGSGKMSPFFPILKMLASLASYLSGIPGGIFAPALATGAGFGADLAYLLPHIPAKAIIILGMVAYFSGVVQAPVTTFVIVIEMVDNQKMIIPLMATAFIAAGTSRLICHKPIYEAMAENYLGTRSQK